jgi:hypothetical protein
MTCRAHSTYVLSLLVIFIVLSITVAIMLRALANDRYLVDSASSHMLVSKIKPCKSKYKQFIQRNCEWLII